MSRDRSSSFSFKTLRNSSRDTKQDREKKKRSFCITNIEDELLKKDRRHSICITPTSEERRQFKMNVKETNTVCSTPSYLNHKDNIFGTCIYTKCFLELYDAPSRCDKPDCKCVNCISWRMRGSRSLFI